MDITKSLVFSKPSLELAFLPYSPFFDSCAHILPVSEIRNPGDVFDSPFSLHQPHFQSVINSFVSSEFLLNLPFPPHYLCSDSRAVTHHLTHELPQLPHMLFPSVNTSSYFLVFSVTKSKKDLLCHGLPLPLQLSRLISHNFLEHSFSSRQIHLIVL